MLNILITGADGFIAKNLRLHLSERNDLNIFLFRRDDPIDELKVTLRNIDVIFHLAGINRPTDISEFETGNTNFTRLLVQLIEDVATETKKTPLIIYASSIQAELNNPYGVSKLNSENFIFEFANKFNANVAILRLPNVFGKWAKPNYNSVVATFCYNVSRNIPITINDQNAQINLAYVDDVITYLIDIMDGKHVPPIGRISPALYPIYTTTVGQISSYLERFKNSRYTLEVGSVGSGFVRCLYSTYLSYMPVDQASYEINQYHDPRGEFVEILKTEKSGQISFFTALPGVTRGGHYHHTKTEKFLVIKGRALFAFRHMDTGEEYKIETTGNKPIIVETLPGWAHDIKNIGSEEMLVILWANEIFDRSKPDTYKYILS